MAALLNSHLVQISLCATSIAELPFPGPKVFTNALLGRHDITALIRDTEAHERALFHLAPPPLPSKSAAQDFVTSSAPAGPAASTTSRRATIYGNRQPKSRAVAAVLGGDLYQRTRKEGAAATRQKGDVDVEVLLEGAEKLLAVYSIPGAADKVSQLRRRHQQLSANIAHYEALVNQQSADLARMNKPTYDEADDEELLGDEPTISVPPMSREDLEREEAEILELERKKKSLEERVTGMERDLGGLMR